jgi:hypothetical protein
MKMTKYVGITCLLKKAIEANGKKYPFAFDSDMPEDLHTAYRLIKTSDPAALTDAALTALLARSKRAHLLADLEYNEGHPLSWITIYPETEGGSGSAGGGGLRGQFEKGPDLEMTKTKGLEQEEPREPKPEKEPLPPEPEPEEPEEPDRGGRDMDMF